MGNWIWLIISFLILIASGDILIRGSVSLARHFKISTLLVGLIVVSIGTSAPELFVSLQAALNGYPDISIGNVVGSNISNIGLVLAITAIILPVVVKKSILIFDWPFLLLSSIALYVFSAYIGKGELDRFDGIIFLLMISVYLYLSVRKSIKQRKHAPMFKKPKYNIYLSLLFILSSIVGMYFGANWLIYSASDIAVNLGISERVISVTIVAFGTSVPELSTSIIAAIKKESDISIGNIIGSNIFNILLILGSTAIISPIKVSTTIINIDMMIMLSITVLLALLIVVSKQKKVSRIAGVILLLFYTFYIYNSFTFAVL
jgi:cation:H+ antiporter